MLHNPGPGQRKKADPAADPADLFGPGVEPGAPLAPPPAPDGAAAQPEAQPCLEAVSRPNYESWYSTPQGDFALGAQQLLLRKMISAWPRRGHNLLELCCGSGFFLESFWKAGFDVTGQERDQALVRGSRSRLGKRVSVTLNSAERLPFDDQSFDYVACINGLEFVPDLEAVVRESFRLATLGILFAFPNTISLHGLKNLFGKTRNSGGSSARSSGGAGADWPAGTGGHGRSETQAVDALGAGGLEYGGYRRISPYRILEAIRRQNVPFRLYWGSVLLGPGGSWRGGKIFGRLNALTLPLPLGACTMLRLDLPPSYTGTLLPLKMDKLSRPAAKAAMAKGGLLGKSDPFPQNRA